jgi:hypothetical protein
MKRLAIFVFISVLFTGCGELKNIKSTESLTKSNCFQTSFLDYEPSDLPTPFHEITIDSILLNSFSFNSLNAANAIGVLNLIEDYVVLNQEVKNDPSIDVRLKILELSQKIAQKISISSLEISAITSELDCEEERADQIANYLKAKEKSNETKLTVGAIVVGAVGAIVSGIFIVNDNTSIAPEYIGIGTGLAEATLGFLILRNEKSVIFKHNRNPLAEIWHGPEVSKIFPIPVWYYLNYASPNQQSLRGKIVENWLDFGQIADTKEKNKEEVYSLYFGGGGVYTASQLENRANMHDQIESYIKLMKQDLNQLATEFQNLQNN